MVADSVNRESDVYECYCRSNNDHFLYMSKHFSFALSLNEHVCVSTCL